MERNEIGKQENTYRQFSRLYRIETIIKFSF